MSLTKTQAIDLFGSRKALQEALGFKVHSTIANWRDDDPIPQVHYLRIRYELKPEAFDRRGKLRQRR